MDAKFLVMVMGVILAFLFIFVRFYRQKELALSALEGQYFEAVMAARSDNTKKEDVQRIGREYARALGLSDEEAHIMLDTDMNPS